MAARARGVLVLGALSSAARRVVCSSPRAHEYWLVGGTRTLQLAPEPAPVAHAAHAALRGLTKRIRIAQRSAPSLSPSELVAQLQLQLELELAPPSEPPPTRPPPLPPLTLLPDPHRPNPHTLSALWLQALFLGASALGLLTRRGPREDHHPRARPHAHAESLEINLVLACYMPWPAPAPAPAPDARAASPWAALTPSNAQKSLVAVTTALARFAALDRAPDRWTLLSVLSLVGALPSTPADPPTNADQARPVLAMWAWNTFVDLPSEHDSDSDRVLVRAFVEYAASAPPGRVGATLDAELLESLSAYLSTSPHGDLVRALAPRALANEDLPSLVRILEHPTALQPPERVALAVQTLELVSADERWRNSREVVREVGEAFAGAVRASYGCSPRTWTRRIRPDTVALDAEGQAAVALGCLVGDGDGDGGGGGEPTRPQLDRALVRRGVDLLRSGYRVDVPLEDLYADAALVLVTHALEAVPESWLLKILRSLVAARHPRLALALLSALPSTSITLDYLNALIRSHHLPTSTAALALLRAHPTLSPSSASLHARLIACSSSPSPSLPLAHAALSQLPVPRDTKTWNLLLSLTSRASSPRALLRASRRMQRAGVRPDHHTLNILLTDHTRRNGRGRVGAAQIRAVIRQLGQGGHDNNKVGLNILLRALGRWSVEINSEHLVSLARTVLGLDLRNAPFFFIDELAGAAAAAPSSIPSRHEWDVERKPAYATLEKAFRMRGETEMRRALVQARVGEERRVRWRERDERERGEQVVQELQA